MTTRAYRPFRAVLLKESKLGITVYDAMYIALAEKLGTLLVTADEELFRKLSDTRYEKLILIVA